MKRLVIIGLMALAGCSTKAVSEMSYSEVQAYAEQMVEKCRKQGVQETQMNACAMQEARADQSRRQRQKQFGAALSNASAAYGQSMQANRPVNCTSTGYGTTVRTTCY